MSWIDNFANVNNSYTIRKMQPEAVAHFNRLSVMGDRRVENTIDNPFVASNVMPKYGMQNCTVNGELNSNFVQDKSKFDRTHVALDNKQLAFYRGPTSMCNSMQNSGVFNCGPRRSTGFMNYEDNYCETSTAFTTRELESDRCLNCGVTRMDHQSYVNNGYVVPHHFVTQFDKMKEMQNVLYDSSGRESRDKLKKRKPSKIMQMWNK